MSSKTLRFRARGTALCQHFERLEAGVRAFVGRKFVTLDAAHPLREAAGLSPDEPTRFGWRSTGEDEEVPYNPEYIRACKEGALWPADEETAKACGVEFDPSFGESSGPPSS